MAVTTHVDQPSLRVTTQGAEAFGLYNLRTQVTHPDLLTPTEWFLGYLINQQLAGGQPIKPGDTVAQGYWLCQFVPAGEGLLDVWELNLHGTAFRPVVDLAVQHGVLQAGVCSKHGAQLVAPRPHHTAQIDAALLEPGDAIEGIRYPSGAPDSGWVFFRTGQAAAARLQDKPLWEITAAQRDLVPFLALPPGYRFALLPDGPKVWFDPEIADYRIKE